MWRATVEDDGKSQHFYLALERGAVKLIGAGTWVTGIGRYIRILEQLGLAGDATAAYKRVTSPLYDQLVNTHQLAQRRLAAIARP